MPITPNAYARAYAKDPATGLIYEIGTSSPSVKSIDDLSDVDTSTVAPTGGDSLSFDGTIGQWVPRPGAAVVPQPLDWITDVDTTTVAPTGGDVLKWDEAAALWVPGVGGVSEVEVGATGPTGPDWEIFVDIGATAPTGTIPARLDDLTDVDLRTRPPGGDGKGQVSGEPETLAWDAASGQWMPARQLFIEGAPVTDPVNEPAILRLFTPQETAGGHGSIGAGEAPMIDMFGLNNSGNGPHPFMPGARISEYWSGNRYQGRGYQGIRFYTGQADVKALDLDWGGSGYFYGNCSASAFTDRALLAALEERGITLPEKPPLALPGGDDVDPKRQAPPTIPQEPTVADVIGMLLDRIEVLTARVDELTGES